jgi:MFS superfamily sulfate permease-like transporter
LFWLNANLSESSSVPAIFSPSTSVAFSGVGADGPLTVVLAGACRGDGLF